MSIPAPNNVLALLSGYSWATPVLGYFFADSKSDYLYRDWYMYGTYGFQPVDAGFQQAVGNILEGHSPIQVNSEYMTLSSVSAVANLTFYSTGDSRSDIAIGQSFLLDRPMAFYPKSLSDVRAGDVWLHGNVSNPRPGSYSYYTLLHELGHALGLKHGHERGDTYNPVVLSSNRNSIEFSVMTYRTHVGDTVEDFGDAVGPQSFMMYDIAALQQLYGANFNTNNTDTLYKWTPEGRTYVNGVEVGSNFHIFMTVWDGGGVDTYDFSSFNGGTTIDLNPGAWSLVSPAQLAPLGDGHQARGNVFNALQYNDDPRSLIENAKGSFGNDQITGNAADNELQGDAGNDTLIGGEGNDTLRGGAQNDYIDGGAGEDVLTGGSGNDTLSYSTAQGRVTVKLHANSVSGDIAQGDAIFGFENVSGGAGDDVIEGDISNNILDGREGHDWFDGRDGADTIHGWTGHDAIHGGDGNDSVYGGAGNDWLEGGEDADLLDGGADWDTVSYLWAASGVSVDLTSNTNGGAAAGDRVIDVEVLQGSNHNDTLTGIDLGNYVGVQLYGEGGIDNLYGRGGGDYLSGGTENDWLDGGDGGDILNGGDGMDYFAFSTALGGGNIDLIQDFAAIDTIVLHHAVFGLPGTNVPGTAFKLGTTATTAAHRIVYNQATGDLFYDADGVGGAAQVKFAVIANHAQLSSTNFLVW